MYISGQISDYGLGAIDCTTQRRKSIASGLKICEPLIGSINYIACQDQIVASADAQFDKCIASGGFRGSNIDGYKPSNSNAFAMNTNRFANPISSVVIPQVQTGYAASPLLRNSGLTRLADGGFDWSSIDVTKMSSADAKALLNVLPKTNLTPQQLAILNLVTAKANQGTTTTGNASTTPDAEVEDGTKWIYGIAFGVLGGGLLWTILNK